MITVWECCGNSVVVVADVEVGVAIVVTMEASMVVISILVVM